MTREELTKVLKDWKPELELMAKYNDNSIDYQRYSELEKAIEVIEQEPCEDCISRDAVQNYVESHIQEINTGYGDLNNHTNRILRMIVDGIRNLPSIQPNPKTGHWKKLNVGYGCSECSLATNKSGVDFYRFCPNCGAKMESEDKE